jgi:class 3 adenylate cyclase
MAWARVALTTTVVVLLGITEGLPALRGQSVVAGQGWVPVLLMPTMLFGWMWMAILARVPYRIALSRISATCDALFIVLFVVVEMQLRGASSAQGLLVGSLPPVLALLFVVATAGVRQDPASSVLAGVIASLGLLVALLRAQRFTSLDALPPALAHLGQPGPWAGRFVIFGFTTVTIALAARNAQRMARATGAAIAQQDKITALFGRYVDPGIANAVIARDGHGARIVDVTVLFTDLRDFTALSEQLAPEDLLAALNDHYEAIVPVVHKHGGTVNKFIGDAIMATFGAPLPHSDHAARALAAAREMLRAMDDLNARRERLGRPLLRMGVGIATGPVVVGSLGAEERVEYAVIGDTVNTASRLEGLCKQYATGLVVSEATRDAIDGGVPLRLLGETHVKGKSAPLRVYTVEVTTT